MSYSVRELNRKTNEIDFALELIPFGNEFEFLHPLVVVYSQILFRLHVHKSDTLWILHHT